MFWYNIGMQKQIVKRTGEVELFDSSKLCSSIINAGASEDLTNQVCSIVSESIDSGMSTDKIFNLTRRYLMKFNPTMAAIYSLDRGLSALGPSGFIFEQYISAMFTEMGYKSYTNFYAQGEAVEHEIDIVAEKGNVVFIIEAKYRNDFKTKTHINQVMYADARIGDIKRKAKAMGDNREYYIWVVTNTRFTNNCINYVSKREIQLMGWDYPKFINLKKIAHEKKLWPITVLPSITKSVLKQCAREDIILVRHLADMNADELQRRFSTTAQLAKKLEIEIKELML